MSKFSDTLSSIASDGHIVVGSLIFLVGSVEHHLKGLDPAFVAFSTTVLGFLGSHAFIGAKYPDNPSPETKP